MAVTYQKHHVQLVIQHFYREVSLLVADELTGVSRQEDINSVQGDRLHTVSKSVFTVKIFKLIHFPKLEQHEKRYVLTVVITSNTLITNKNTQLIESCIHVVIITARRTGW